MKPTRILGRSIVSLLAIIPLTTPAAQDSITATGAQNATNPAASWADPTDWSLGAIPTVNDNAVILGAGAVDIRGSGFAGTVPPFFTEIQDLTFNNTAATTLANDSTSQDMTLALNGGRGAGVPLISTIGNFAHTIQSPGNVAAGATAHILTLQLKSSGSIDVADTGSLTISSAITQSGGTFGLTKAGLGTLVLNNTNTFGGGVTVDAGILQISNSGAPGFGSIVVNGASLALHNLTITNGVTFNGGTILTRTGDNSNFAGSVAIDGATTAILRSYTTPANDHHITVSGVLSGAADLTIDGNASNATSGKAFILTATANTYSGTFHVNAGQRLRSAPAATGSTLSTAAIDLNGGTLQLRDDGAGDNGVLAYGNNVTVLTGNGGVDVDRVSANSGNTFILGTLAIGAHTLNITGGNGYTVSFGATTLAGAATFNTDTANATLSGPVSGVFGLTKSGASDLILPATNTYSGPTTITGGRLVLTGSMDSSPRIDVGAGGTFDVTGLGSGFTLSGTHTLSGAGSVAGDVLAASGSRIEAGDAIGAGTLTVFGNLIFGAAAGDTATLRLTPNETTLGINVFGTDGLITNGGPASVTVNIAGMAPALGTYVLVDYEGAIGGTGFGAFTLGTLPPRMIAALQDNGVNSSVDLNVTGVDFPIWKGALGTEWSIATLAEPKNWVLDSNNNLTTDFLTNDSVIFNNVATGTTVDVSVADVAPFAVNFNNDTKNFTITGSKGIAGAASLIKNGSGVVTISNTNSFTGAVILNQGTVRVAAVADAGVNSPLGAGSTLSFDGGTLEFTGASGRTNRAITLDDGGGTFNTATSLTLAGTVSGIGTLTKTGSGTVVLTGANTYGDTVISGGALQVGNGGTTGTLGTGIVSNDGTLILDGSDPLIVANEITGAGGVVKNGSNTATLGGTAFNSYTGVTTVNAGVLVAGKPAGTTAVSGDLIIQAGATFRYAGNNVSHQIADTSSIVINGGTFGDPANVGPTNPGATDTVANLTINGGAFGSGRNSTIAPFAVTGLLHVMAGTALAQRGGAISAESVLISGGSINLDGGSATAANESRLNVGAGGLVLTGTLINFNAGPSPGAANSVGSIVTLGGDVTASGESAFVRVNGVVPRALVDLGGGIRTFDIVNGTTTIDPDIENGGILKTGAGTLNLDGVQNYGSLEATGGTTNLNQPLGTGFSTLTATATVNLATSQTLASLDIGAGGAVQLGAPGPAPLPGDDLGAGAVVAVPEPGTFSLLLCGALGVLFRRRTGRI